MSKPRVDERPTTDEWPSYDLEYTFNPNFDGIVADFEPDEVVVFDPRNGMTRGRWLSADRGSYVSVEDIR